MELPYYVRYPVEEEREWTPSPDPIRLPSDLGSSEDLNLPTYLKEKRATAGSMPQSAIRQGTRQELQLTPSPEPITLPDCKEGEDFVLPTYVMREPEEEEQEEVVVPAQKVQSRGAVVSYAALPPKPSFKPEEEMKLEMQQEAIIDRINSRFLQTQSLSEKGLTLLKFHENI
eukprot:sb/3472136/